jgi:hypothetical protein
MLAEVPANVGNVDFKIGVANARGGALAALLARVAAGHRAVERASRIHVLFDLELRCS